jgi:predicted phosphodiesterase
MIELHPGPFGLLSDAHGNPHGLRAALQALRIRGAQTIFFLGDAVGYLPLEQGIMALLREAGAVCISGNHEAMLLGRLACRADDIYRLSAARARLSAADLEVLASWPDLRLVADSRASDRTLLLAHGSPSSPLKDYIYPDSDLAFLDDLNAAAFACGHTHRAFVARRGVKLIVNCGSVGLPRDSGGMASCALLDLATFQCEILRLPFDVDLLIEECDRVERPHEKALSTLRRPAGVSTAGMNL